MEYKFLCRCGAEAADGATDEMRSFIFYQLDHLAWANFPPGLLESAQAFLINNKFTG